MSTNDRLWLADSFAAAPNNLFKKKTHEQKIQRARQASELWNRMLLSMLECVQSIDRLSALLFRGKKKKEKKKEKRTTCVEMWPMALTISHQTELWRQALCRVKHKWQFKAWQWQNFKQGSGIKHAESDSRRDHIHSGSQPERRGGQCTPSEGKLKKKKP